MSAFIKSKDAIPWIQPNLCLWTIFDPEKIDLNQNISICVYKRQLFLRCWCYRFFFGRELMHHVVKITFTQVEWFRHYIQIKTRCSISWNNEIFCLPSYKTRLFFVWKKFQLMFCIQTCLVVHLFVQEITSTPLDWPGSFLDRETC